MLATYGQVRPTLATSVMGDKTSGPTPYPQMNRDMLSPATDSDTWNSSAISGSPGTTMLLPRYTNTVMVQMRNVIQHLNHMGQFFGFSGSFSPSQVTIFLSGTGRSDFSAWMRKTRPPEATWRSVPSAVVLSI